ncbi:MAG: sugar ABC transporter permease [Gemmatimonadetes bacterium]|nr:MAG: sugar ABC transporter permease [Gemmatimonadota bacterium]
MRAHSPCCSSRCSLGRRGPSSSCSMGEWSMRKPDGSRGSRGSWGAWLTYALALPLAILMIAPFLYMVVSALMSEPDSLRHPVPDNFTGALVSLPFGRFLLNSLIFSLAVVAGQVLTSATAAYAFARLRFPGRDRLFLAYLCALMAPAIVLVIPRFLLIDAFGWVDSYQGLISTELVSVSGIFLLRQFFRTIPRDLEDAARLEGAGEWTIFWRVIVPLARPALATLAVLAFADQWRSFMWPLVATRSSGMQPLEVGIANLEGVYHVSWSYQMAAAVAAVIPLMVLYFVAHRYFIRGIEQTARV